MPGSTPALSSGISTSPSAPVKDEITPDVVETFLSTDIYEKVISAINE